MKGIISSHSALTAYQRQTAVDPVSVPQSPAQREGAAAPSSVRAARVSISAEARALAASDPGYDQAKVERLRNLLAAGNLKLDSSLVAERMIDRAE
jgi:flagellar biosynthesis anti-sigma factor FlgM